MGKLWEVVGGGDKGGVLVREADGLKSKTYSKRLSTGAIVEEIGSKGERINYKLVEGDGPEEGWVAIRLPDKELLVPKGEGGAKKEGGGKKLEGGEFYDMGEDGVPIRKLPAWKKVDPEQFEYGEMRERALLKVPGDYFGLEFPGTEEQVNEAGPTWFTKAFKRSGVLTNDNKVVSVIVKNVTGTVSGGAGLKFTLKVKYLKAEPYLHTDLFMKLPHDPKKGSDRYYVSCMWGHDRPESIFNIWLGPYVPFKVPKMYFADISKKSTAFILITEQVKYAEKGKKDFKPGDIEPSYLKYADIEMPDGGPMYYTASCKALGLMAAYHKTGKLHPQINEMFPMPPDIWEVPKGIPGMDPGAKQMEFGKIDQWIRFMSDTAAAIYPKSITEKAWLEELKDRVGIILDYGNEIHCYCCGAGTASPNDYVGFTHNNLQVDNAIFYHDDDNALKVGMLDWGAMGCGALINSIVGGCISGAQVDVFCEHREGFIRAAVDAYAENGGPKLDMERMLIACDLHIANWVSGLGKNTGAVLKDIKPKTWPEIKDLNDPKIRASWNAWAWCSQFNNALLIYQKLDVYQKFQDWLKTLGMPPRK